VRADGFRALVRALVRALPPESGVPSGISSAEYRDRADSLGYVETAGGGRSCGLGGQRGPATRVLKTTRTGEHIERRSDRRIRRRRTRDRPSEENSVGLDKVKAASGCPTAAPTCPASR
jgi:hypothetical protein